MTTRDDSGANPKELAEKAIDDFGRLAKAEVATATNELQRKAVRIAPSAVAFGVGGLCALVGLQTIALSFGTPRPVRSLFGGIAMIALASLGAALGFAMLPSDTKDRMRAAVAQA